MPDTNLDLARACGEQREIILPAEELALAKASPQGAYLSPAAQALYEIEGAARFAKFHRAVRVSGEKGGAK